MFCCLTRYLPLINKPRQQALLEFDSLIAVFPEVIKKHTKKTKNYYLVVGCLCQPDKSHEIWSQAPLPELLCLIIARSAFVEHYDVTMKMTFDDSDTESHLFI